jgi:hypothetical protein
MSDWKYCVGIILPILLGQVLLSLHVIHVGSGLPENVRQGVIREMGFVTFHIMFNRSGPTSNEV